MSTAWTWPAYVGVLGGVGLFALIFVPALVWQYRRYGSPSGRRLLGTAAISVYAVALVAYTLLPLPSGDLQAWCAANAAGHNWDLLAFVSDVREGTADLGLAQALRTPVVLQLVLNVALFVPWGVIVRGLFGRGIVLATLTGFGASVLIETTQYTGIFGAIPCSYRVGDVDDVLTNTTGALLGALVAPLLLRWMPRTGALEAARGVPRPVGVWRRWTAMVLDGVGSLLLAALGGVGLGVVRVAVGSPTTGERTGVETLLVDVVPYLLVFVLPVFVGSGASWGQRTVWLRPVLAGTRSQPGRARLLLRASVPGGLWWWLTSASEIGLPGALVVLGWLLALAALVWVLFSRRGMSGAVAGLDMVDARGHAPSPAR